MRRLLVSLLLALGGASAVGQSGQVPSDILDHMSIFSQSRTAGDAAPKPPEPPGAEGVRPRAVPAFVGAIEEAGNRVAVIELAGPNAQYMEVRAGDTIAGNFRVQEITLERIQVSDGTRSRVVDIGNDLMNQPRVLPIASPAPRGPVGPGVRRRMPPGRGAAAQ